MIPDDITRSEKKVLGAIERLGRTNDEIALSQITEELGWDIDVVTTKVRDLKNMGILLGNGAFVGKIFHCPCGRNFEKLLGLRVHQGRCPEWNGNGGRHRTRPREDPGEISEPRDTPHVCTCGRSFATKQGLITHRARSKDPRCDIPADTGEDLTHEDPEDPEFTPPDVLAAEAVYAALWGRISTDSIEDDLEAFLRDGLSLEDATKALLKKYGGDERAIQFTGGIPHVLPQYCKSPAPVIPPELTDLAAPAADVIHDDDASREEPVIHDPEGSPELETSDPDEGRLVLNIGKEFHDLRTMLYTLRDNLIDREIRQRLCGPGDGGRGTLPETIRNLTGMAQDLVDEGLQVKILVRNDHFKIEFDCDGGAA